MAGAASSTVPTFPPVARWALVALALALLNASLTIVNIWPTPFVRLSGDLSLEVLATAVLLALLEPWVRPRTTGVARALAFLVLGERLTTLQVAGVGLLISSMLLIRPGDLLPRGFNPNALLVHDMANIQFQRIAFHRAFGKAEHDNEYGVMGTLTTAELKAIQRMLGANGKPVDPFPMSKGGYSVDLTAFLPQKPADKDAEDSTKP